MWIKDVQPVVTKQTVSSDVSALIRQHMGLLWSLDENFPGSSGGRRLQYGRKNRNCTEYPVRIYIWYHLSVSHRWMIAGGRVCGC